MTEEHEQFVKQFIQSRRWQFAKSMPNTPHTYTIRGWHRDQDAFEQFASLIWVYGVPERFYRRVGVYLHVDGEKFWTMGSPIAETTVINRANADEYYGRQDPKPEKPFQDLGKWSHLAEAG